MTSSHSAASDSPGHADAASPNQLTVSKATLYVPLAIAAFGAIVAVAGLAWDPERTWPNLLLVGYYTTMLTLAAVFFSATQRMTGARWSVGLRRMPEALMSGLPVVALILVAVFVFGRHTLYHWSHPGAFAHEPAIAGKAKYLQPELVGLRTVAFVALWSLFSFLFRSWSRRQDASPSESMPQHDRLQKMSTIFVILFAFSFTFASYDFIISLETTWFSTMFGVFMFAGAWQNAIAVVALITVLLWERGYLRPHVGEKQFHDVGKMLFAFSVFWAYIWTCQYLLIWYGNMPEEVTHYQSRTNGRWVYLFGLNFIINWVVPFLVLLSAKAKSTPRVLKGVACLIIFGHWLDLYMAIAPSVWKEPRFGIIEIALAAGGLSLVFFFTVRALTRAPLVPLHDPVMRGEEILAAHSHHHLAHEHSQGERS